MSSNKATGSTDPERLECACFVGVVWCAEVWPGGGVLGCGFNEHVTYLHRCWVLNCQSRFDAGLRGVYGGIHPV